MSGHTPGPWRIEGPSKFSPGRSDGGDYAVLDSTGEILAETFAQVARAEFRPAEANARLIAAAPTMVAYIQARPAAGCDEAKIILEAINAST